MMRMFPHVKEGYPVIEVGDHVLYWDGKMWLPSRVTKIYRGKPKDEAVRKEKAPGYQTGMSDDDAGARTFSFWVVRLDGEPFWIGQYEVWGWGWQIRRIGNFRRERDGRQYVKGR